MLTRTRTWHAEQPTPAAEDGWDPVHDAALESFPASDAPSWSPLRVGPPAGERLGPTTG